MHHRPTSLKPHDLIALAAPSRFCTEEQVHSACVLIENAGFTPYIPDGLLAREGQFGGSDQHRATLFNRLLSDPRVKAIWCMRGGYGAARLLPLIKWPQPVEMPWLIGFSDITALHAAVHLRGVMSLHAPVLTTAPLASREAIDCLFGLLEGDEFNHTFRSAGLQTAIQPIKAPLLGGNLSVLYSLHGTPWFPQLDGAVLFIEDVDEMLYHLDRMLFNFELAGIFDRIAALVVGGLTGMRDNTVAHGFSSDNPYGKTALEIVYERIGRRLLPVVTGVKAGHIDDHHPLVLGATVQVV